jgi:hypothetical protein
MTNVVPYTKPDVFKIEPSQFDSIKKAMAVEAVGKVDDKKETCNESIQPYSILGYRDLSKVKFPYITAESVQRFYSEKPLCSIRPHMDHVSLEKTSLTATILKELCGF